MSAPDERRTTLARDRGREAVAALAEEAGRQPMPLTCQPPPPGKPFDYGDLVPLGFLLRALAADGASPIREGLEALLRSKRQGLLWAYHSDTLVTCTDSALVLQGFRDRAGVDALEAFADDRGGYLPQLCSEKPQNGRMTISPHNKHWCQPDFATTCLVGALRAEAGLPPKTGVEYLAGRYACRSGLYFANPYMTDWALAWALQSATAATELRERLAAEILASANEDGSFGTYDVATSTALAILALNALGAGGGSSVERARLRLADMMMPDGRWPPGVPFYSAVKFPRERFSGGVLVRLMLGERRGQYVWLEGDVYAVSFYVDRHGMISTALAVLALTQPGAAAASDADSLERHADGRHPRYGCADRMAYVAGYALPPYVG